MNKTLHTSTPINIIDSHHHLWKLERGDYAWLTTDLTALYRDFDMNDLAIELNACGITQTILVQAAASQLETDYLLNIAASSDVVCGVVGWVDMQAHNAVDVINGLQTNPLFKGIRPMLQDLPDAKWITQDQFSTVFTFLEQHKLTFDALVKTEHLPSILTIARTYPNLKIVIDHCAKPQLNGLMDQRWIQLLAELATCPNVYIKFSGLMTEAPIGAVSLEMVKPIFEFVFSTFGSQKIMWGSDWPVLKLNGDYQQWFKLSKTLFADLSEEEQKCIWANNARTFYKLPV